MRYLLLCLLLTACGPVPENKGKDGLTANTNSYWFDVKEFTLKDGTKCVAVSHYHGLGVSCNW